MWCEDLWFETFFFFFENPFGKILISCATQLNRWKHIRRMKNPANYQDFVNSTNYKDSIGSLEKDPLVEKPKS